MSIKTIERELAEVKKRLERLEAKVVAQRDGGWRVAFGAMKGSTLYREAARLGAEYRAKENKRK